MDACSDRYVARCTPPEQLIPRRSDLVRIATIAAVVLAIGCRRGETSSTDDRDGAAPALSSATIATAPSSASAPIEPLPKAPLQLLRFRFTTGIHGKEPVDELLAIAPSERVYAHFALRNRGGDVRKIHVVFRVNGDARTNLDLDVQPSWSYRTWAYNTLKDGDDKGDVSVTVTDDTGATLVNEKIPIAKKTKTK